MYTLWPLHHPFTPPNNHLHPLAIPSIPLSSFIPFYQPFDPHVAPLHSSIIILEAIIILLYPFTHIYVLIFFLYTCLLIRSPLYHTSYPSIVPLYPSTDILHPFCFIPL